MRGAVAGSLTNDDGLRSPMEHGAWLAGRPLPLVCQLGPPEKPVTETWLAENP